MISHLNRRKYRLAEQQGNVNVVSEKLRHQQVQDALVSRMTNSGVIHTAPLSKVEAMQTGETIRVLGSISITRIV